jgi:hypothetical protein
LDERKIKTDTFGKNIYVEEFGKDEYLILSLVLYIRK